MYELMSEIWVQFSKLKGSGKEGKTGTCVQIKIDSDLVQNRQQPKHFLVFSTLKKNNKKKIKGGFQKSYHSLIKFSKCTRNHYCK